MTDHVSHFIFDVESVADGDLVAVRLKGKRKRGEYKADDRKQDAGKEKHHPRPECQRAALSIRRRQVHQWPAISS